MVVFDYQHLYPFFSFTVCNSLAFSFKRLQIHDELLFETIKSISEVKRLHSAIMRCCGEECVEELQLKVPLKLTCMVGDNWGKMEDIDTIISSISAPPTST